MSFFKILGVKILALALAFSLAPSTMPAGFSVPGIGVSQAEAGSRWDRGGRYYGGGRHYRGDRYYGHRRGYRGGHRRGGDAAAAAVIGGIVGLGIGAAIASQPRYVEPRYVQPRPVYRTRPVVQSYGAPRPWSGEWYRYCAARYRSFDAGSGTFQPYHGPRQLCR
ncbi:BA14K family protein [Fulvimarina sp. 2208YS6-2-32]|uniref:Lectin-like protein BA14k n=1 Tax=Fulvimarina uroteuthidis TaxID=3098149 RepID=A0ABU5HXM5_9HYPH|nr:BA14K family protein [Fulvimarina sp. 2208YS6-2-32]MDY8107894.1 BA14K family protein [Fulvimarina sp. 2208YS6-2-32]